jgi:hypothetical protein
MYDCTDGGQSREVELWHEWFVQNPQFAPNRAIVFALAPGGHAGLARPVVAPGALKALSLFEISTDSPGTIRAGIDQLLTAIVEGGGGPGAARKSSGGGDGAASGAGAAHK